MTACEIDHTKADGDDHQYICGQQNIARHGYPLYHRWLMTDDKGWIKIGQAWVL